MNRKENRFVNGEIGYDFEEPKERAIITIRYKIERDTCKVTEIEVERGLLE